MSEREIFANYELDASGWKKFMLALLGGSLVLHVIVFLSTVYVPSIRDAFYVALLFSDSPTAWENKAYKKTEIEEATVINLPNGPLYYPVGYFELANGSAPAPDYAAMTTRYTPEVIDSENSFPPLEFNQPQPLPTLPPLPRPTNPAGRISPKLPSSRKGAKLEELKAKGQTDTTEESPSPTPKEELAQAASSPTPAPGDPNQTKLNNKPLLELADKAIKKIENKEIDLTKPVNVTVSGVLGNNGKLIGKTTYKNNGGDDELALMASELIAAMNDSGMLEKIKDLADGSTKRDVTFNISKDEKEVKFQLVSAVGSDTNAQRLASGLKLIIALAMFRIKENSEEKELLQQLQFTSEKGQVIVNWAMDTPTAMKKIQNKLADVKKKQQQPANQNTNINAQAETK